MKQLSSRQQACRAPASKAGHPISRRTPVTAAVPSRRQLLAGISGVSLLLLGQQKAEAASSSSSSSSDTQSSFISITPIKKDAKDFMDRRDEAMEYKCKGGMFDCDGDRRDFAKKQYQEWLDAGGVPKRIREGKPEGPRAF